MSQENSDNDIEEDQSSDSLDISMNFDEEHLSENEEDLATIFDSLLFDFEERNLLASLRVNLKKKIKTTDISLQRKELRKRPNLAERYKQSCERFDLVSLRLREDQMHLALFLEETALTEASKIETFSDLELSLREELAAIMEPIMCHFTMTLGKSSMVQWFNDTILPLFLNDSPSTLYILCEECWITVHDTLKRKVKSMYGFREYKKKKKLEIIQMKQENSKIELPTVTFTKHPFSDLGTSPKIAPVKTDIKENSERKLNSLTYVNASSTLIKSSTSSSQSFSTSSSRNFFSPISSLNSSSSGSSSPSNSTFISPNSSLSGSPAAIAGSNLQLANSKCRSPTEMRWNKRRDLCGTKKQVKVVKSSNVSPSQSAQTKRKRELEIAHDTVVISSGSHNNSFQSSSSGSTSDEYIDLLNIKKSGKPEENAESLSKKYQYKPGRFRF